MAFNVTINSKPEEQRIESLQSVSTWNSPFHEPSSPTRERDSSQNGGIPLGPHSFQRLAPLSGAATPACREEGNGDVISASFDPLCYSPGVENKMITGSPLAPFPRPGVALLRLFENEKSRPTFSFFLVSNAVDRFLCTLPRPYPLWTRSF